MRFEKVETITLTHVLLALLLFGILANHSELVKLNKTTIDVADAVIDVQNAASENKDEIKSSLEDLKDAVQASAR